MKCPYCGGEMQHGQITGSKVLRLSPPAEPPKNLHRIGLEDGGNGVKKAGLVGEILDVPYAGLALWIPADYCQACKKMIFDTDIIG